MTSSRTPRRNSFQSKTEHSQRTGDPKEERRPVWNSRGMSLSACIYMRDAAETAGGRRTGSWIGSAERRGIGDWSWWRSNHRKREGEKTWRSVTERKLLTMRPSRGDCCALYSYHRQSPRKRRLRWVAAIATIATTRDVGRDTSPS
jgi:hypothetical protein